MNCPKCDHPHARTVAHLTLQHPDGRLVPLTYDFGYGYPAESARFMWYEGNYSCDCNKLLFMARALGEPEPDDPPCGDTIPIVSFTLTQEPR